MATNPTAAERRTGPAAPALVFDPEQFLKLDNLAVAFFDNAAKNADAIAYDQAQRDGDADGRARPRRYRAVTHAECAARVLKLAAHLARCGIGPGDCIAVLSFDRPEWTEAEMAAYTAGARIVPAYVRDAPERLAYLLRDAGARAAIVENQQQFEKLQRLMASGDIPPLRPIVSLEELGAARSGDAICYGQILSESSAPPAAETFAGWRVQRGDVACIYYTSGSSGQPKGVPATHGQILANLQQIAAAGLVDYDHLRDLALQPIVTFLLPERAHAYPARSAQLVFTSPARARFPAIVDRSRCEIDEAYRQSVRRDLREAGAGMIPIVPKIALAIEQRVRQRLAAGGIGERLAEWIVLSEVAHTLRAARGERPIAGGLLQGLVAPLRRRIAGRIRREIVGPEFEYFISGGAKLPLETAAFLFAIGLPIYEGYGSTETNCPIASNTPREHRLGSVGRPFTSIEVKIDDATSELLVRGPNVADRYWHHDEESRATWDADGWYHTRDIASLDADGYLRVEGRLDSMVVLLNGENVSPVPIENRCCAIPGVESAIVIGDHRPALVALLALSEQSVRRWASDAGHRLTDPWQRDPHVAAWLREQIELHVNQPAGHPYECIRHVAIIDPPTVEDKTLTATEKIRRREIERRYAPLIDELYAETHQWLGRQSSPPARRVAAL